MRFRNERMTDLWDRLRPLVSGGLASCTAVDGMEPQIIVRVGNPTRRLSIMTNDLFPVLYEVVDLDTMELTADNLSGEAVVNYLRGIK